MAPEQARGEPLDHRADLFSLGSVLYALCTGRPPFRALGTMAVLKRVIEDTPRPVRETNPEVPDWLEAIIAKLHAKKPEERFQTAKEVAELLGQHLAHLQQPNKEAMRAKIETPSKLVSVQPRRWRRFGVPAMLVLLSVAISAWFGPAVLRYAGNRAEVEFVPQPGLTSLI